MPRVIFWAVMPIAAVVLTGWSWAQEPSPSGTPPRGSVNSQATLPKDIDPDSKARLPNVKREDLDEDGKKTYDFVVNPKSFHSRGLPTPIGMWMHSPRMAEHILPVYMYLRFGNAFGQRLTELAILVTAREINSQYQWTSHEPQAPTYGLEQNIVDVVKYRRGTAGLGEKEALMITFGRELLTDRKVTSETFAHAMGWSGSRWRTPINWGDSTRRRRHSRFTRSRPAT